MIQRCENKQPCITIEQEWDLNYTGSRLQVTSGTGGTYGCIGALVEPLLLWDGPTIAQEKELKRADDGVGRSRVLMLQAVEFGRGQKIKELKAVPKMDRVHYTSFGNILKLEPSENEVFTFPKHLSAKFT